MTPRYNIDIVNDPTRSSFRVYVWTPVNEGDGFGRRMYMIHDAAPMIVAAGAEAPMYMMIPEDIGLALGKALNPDPPEASVRHLDDAVGVRDRLLTMIENSWTSRDL